MPRRPFPVTPEFDPTAQKKILQFCYIMYGLVFLTGITAIVAIVVDYIKRDDARQDPVLFSHYRWQIRTFWFGLLWSCVAAPMVVLFGLGVAMGFVVSVWYVYRLVKGWIRLMEYRPMYVLSTPAI